MVDTTGLSDGNQSAGCQVMEWSGSIEVVLVGSGASWMAGEFLRVLWWSVVTVNLPDNLREKAREVAASKNLSMDALVTIALAQSLSRLVRDPHLEERAARASGKGISEFLAQVPRTEPPEWDRLPQRYQRKKWALWKW
jgi:hypothetical protein